MTFLNAPIKSTYRHCFRIKTQLQCSCRSKNWKCNRIIGLIRGLSITLPRNVLLTIYKSFVRPHLNYGDIVYDKRNNENFQNELEKVQYGDCLATTGALQGTSTTKLDDELGLHSLIKRRWCNELLFFYKIVNGL